MCCRATEHPRGETVFYFKIKPIRSYVCLLANENVELKKPFYLAVSLVFTAAYLRLENLISTLPGTSPAGGGPNARVLLDYRYD